MTASKFDLLSAAIGAGAALTLATALSVVQNPNASKSETIDPPASSQQKVSGTRMSDGSILAGASPDTGRAMYTTPRDAPLTYTFDQAIGACATLDAHGHRDWRVPNKADLSVLFRNRAAIGGFDTSGSIPAGWYWSSSRNYTVLSAWAQRFSDGTQGSNVYRGNASALRCVRG